MNPVVHEYIDRATGSVMHEQLLGNAVIAALYSPALEKAPLLTRMASSRYMSRVLGYLNYDNVLSARATGMLKFLRESGIPLSEFVGNLSEYDSARKIFERQIRYWICRPMPNNSRPVVCPADARALVGSMAESSGLYIKQKFFSFPELLGEGSPWQRRFRAETTPSFVSRRRSITTRIVQYADACSISTPSAVDITRAIRMRRCS